MSKNIELSKSEEDLIGHSIRTIAEILKRKLDEGAQNPNLKGWLKYETDQIITFNITASQSPTK